MGQYYPWNYLDGIQDNLFGMISDDEREEREAEYDFEGFERNEW